jgi:hypothetical protein
MALVELYVTNDCKLCEEAKALLTRVQKEFPFELRLIPLTDDHPRFKEFVLALPVALVDNAQEFASVIHEAEFRTYLREHYPPLIGFYFGKALEAFGFLIVALGLMFGVRGDMWSDVYYLIVGVAVFYAGRWLERSSVKRRYHSPPLL